MSEHSSDDDQSDSSSIYKNNRNTLETIAKIEADELALQFETVKKFLNYFLEASIHSEVVLNCISVLSFWEVLVQRAQEGDWSIRGCEECLDKRFGPIANGTPLEKLWDWGFLDNIIAAFSDAFIKQSNYKPPPSEFARPDSWPSVQNKHSDLLCLRPTNRIGLPLVTLHDVFRKFLIRLNSDMDDRQVLHLATISAACLCKTMGDDFYFESELDRSQEFDKCLGTLLNPWHTQYDLGSLGQGDDPKVHRAFRYATTWHMRRYKGILLILREDKDEWVDVQSDVYLQVARDYEIYARNIWEAKTSYEGLCSQGIPAFLVCVFGPMVFVAGGFYDGCSTIVEPLGNPCFMLGDYIGSQQEYLKRLLYALRKGVDDISEIISVKHDIEFPPGTPRLYHSCDVQDDHGNQSEAKLSFTERQPFYGPHKLIFEAIMHPVNSRPSVPVTVKLAVSEYGEDVHRLLAQHGLAPKLYGVKRVEGAPTAYVMERIESSWRTLSDVLVKKSLEESEPGFELAHKEGIRLSLKKVLDILRHAGLVHGDLRANNIMVDVDERLLPSITDGLANIRVLKFDWAGTAGEVFYPYARNEEVEDATWPAEAGEPIEMGHDELLVASWWKHYFDNEVF